MRQVVQTPMVRCSHCNEEVPRVRADFAANGNGFSCFSCSEKEKIMRYRAEDDEEARRDRGVWVNGDTLAIRLAIGAGITFFLVVLRVFHLLPGS
jgi:hypothetical protein